MGTATMAKRPGRKRKDKKRTKSGQISRAGMPRDTGTPELSRRLWAMKGKGSPAIQTDKLCAAGLITDQQREVADVYREMYSRAWGKPQAKIGGYGEMISEGTLRPIVDVDASADPQAKAQKAYMAGRMAVQERCGSSAGVEVTRVVIDNADPVARDMDGLRAALDVLREVYFFGA